MSRLDSALRRLQAQRACLDAAAAATKDVPGVILELGLGNGRTYDHLRSKLPSREIFVFERELNAHPDCIPDAAHLILGDIAETLPPLSKRFERQAALIHADIGTGDPERNARFAIWLGNHLPNLLAPGAVLLCDQEIGAMEGARLPLPDGIQPGRYFFYIQSSSSSKSSSSK